MYSAKSCNVNLSPNGARWWGILSRFRRTVRTDTERNRAAAAMSRKPFTSGDLIHYFSPALLEESEKFRLGDAHPPADLYSAEGTEADQTIGGLLR